MLMKKKETKKYGLLGKNISYSLSPAMHNAAFRYFGIPAEYRIFDVNEQDIPDFIEKNAGGKSLSGFNVTVPYKIMVKDMISSIEGCSIDKSGGVIGSINTVKVEGARLIAFNTDGQGFYESLKDDAGFDPKGKNIFICGAGGAGRAVSLYLASLGHDAPSVINVFDVDREKISSILSASEAFAEKNILKECLSGDVEKKIAESDLIVNATPIGTKDDGVLPCPVRTLKKSSVVYDLVYCRETELVKRAKKIGCVAVNGLGMLVNQGALAFGIWTGKQLHETKKIMRDALKNRVKQ
ncbi:MAG TPA: shikimate dehydrogenase [Candidatus Omnitrophota bacterium]|nr:shikimate dehydrogenase [Candidatus Omnitrophota bacterium]HPS19824.1 shikimate dehydrogenase [Candidatus Omnitrophota bacterium]